MCSEPAEKVVVPTNPGGVLAPEHVLGRDAFIEQLWGWLEVKSIALLAPRRVGKTSICRKMNAKPAHGFTPHWRDVEGLKQAQEFVRLVFEDTEHVLSRKKRVAEKARRLAKALFGAVDTTWGKIQLPPSDWKALLREIFADLHTSAEEGGDCVVLIWDEFPIFIDDLAASSHEDATALLDTLRALRQTYPRIRMILTGSVGLNEVLEALKRRGYNNDPFNDMERVTVPMLDEENAGELARALLRGVGDPQALAAAGGIVTLSEGHPYVIQYLVQRLRQKKDYSAEAVGAALDDMLLASSEDPLALSHYLDRLQTYLEPAAARLARQILDEVSMPGGSSSDDIVTRTGGDRDEVVGLLSLLRRDLYLAKSSGVHTFKLEMLRRWWRHERDLD